MENVLITGATGFMGSRLVEALLARGVRVTHLSPTGELAGRFGDRARGIVCSLDELEPVADMLKGERFDAVYHLAWDGVSSEHKNDYDRQFGNIVYGVNVCALASQIGCSHVIVPGSMSEHAYAPGAVDGSLAPSPGDAYAAAKSMTHIACDLYARQHGLALTWLLVSSVYGPTRDDSNIITYTIKSLLAGKRPSYTLLEQVWDYIFIDDLIEALCLAGERAQGRTYALGSGDARPLCEYIEIIRDAIDPYAELGIGEMAYKTGRVDNSVADISAFTRDTGFVPNFTFEHGISLTIAAFRDSIERAERS